MKLRTSFFNPAVLKKDITRFAPLWGLYTVFMLLFLLLLQDTSPAAFASGADDIMIGMGVLNMIYAGLAAAVLFGDLFKARLCGALHAMPLRREGWFFTHVTAGMLFCLIPNALGAVLSASFLGQYAYLAYLWLALMLLEYLCFFGIACFSIQCAGSGFGSVFVYAIINFLPVLVLWLIKSFYEPVLFGVTVHSDALSQLSPVVGFTSHRYVDVRYVMTSAVFHGFYADGWRYLLFAALAGLALMAASVFMYRKRHLESAGDLIAFRPAAPVFHVLYALCVGAALYLFAAAIDSGPDMFFLLTGLAIGWFTGQMLLEKRLKVFRPKILIGFGIFVFAFYLSMTVVWLDPLGITRYVPQPEQVKQVQVSPYTSDYYYGRSSAVVTDPGQIAKLTQIHRDLISKWEENRDHMPLRLRYTLKNGKQVERTYYLDSSSEYGQWLKTVYSSPETVLGSSDLAELKQTIRFAEVYKYDEKYTDQPERLTWKCDPQDYDALLDALMADCLSGNMTQLYEYRQDQENVAVLELEFDQEYRDVVIYPDCRNTVAFLQAHWPTDQ